ncbi:hypothetical protein ABZW18_11885 [Streptomyces sp. NPDC004647]|uniref:hypothetical protein n=1 Tax=Streptomyces sp. NPDC004647 TaxID=3154671 RepID=UPI0033BC3A40
MGTPTRIAAACARRAPLLGGFGAAGAADPPGTVHIVSPGKGTPIQSAANRARADDSVLGRPGHYKENVPARPPAGHSTPSAPRRLGTDRTP